MKASTNNVTEICESRFEKIRTDFCTCGGKIIREHFGEFSQNLVNAISSETEKVMLEGGDSKGVVKRVFSILVEGLQNIRLHGERDPDNNQTSFLLIQQCQDFYKVAIGNLVNNKNVSGIKKRIKEINEMDLMDVKKLYMEVLTNGIISSKGGAGLGFITMVMKSKNHLDYFFDDIDENLSCFTLIIEIDRKK